MTNGKCKRKTAAYLDLQTSSKRKAKKRSTKIKKPVAQRSGSVSSGSITSGAVTDEAMEALSEFFVNLNTQLHPDEVSVAARELDMENLGDLQEIEDVGQLARDLIRRIQSLRGQFRPGSEAARALPDVRFEENTTALPDGAIQNDSSSAEEDASGHEVEV
jgi:hypothetical protein